MGFFDFLFGKKKVEPARVSTPAPAPAPAPAAKPAVAPAPKLAPPITNVRVGESLVGEGNEVAHIDLLVGPRGSAAGSHNASIRQRIRHRPSSSRSSPELPCGPS